MKTTPSNKRQTNDGYGAICRLFNQYGIIRRNLHQWRHVPETPLGQINGIPASFGRLHATDGIECLIIQGSNAYFIGHFQYFIADPSESDDWKQQKQTKAKALERYYV